MTKRPAVLPLLAQYAYFAAIVMALLWFVFIRTTWIGRSASSGTFGLSSRVAPIWSPPTPISDSIPPNVVRIPFWPRGEDSVVPYWSIVLLKLSAAVILINLLFGALARRLWKPGANDWLDFAWYSGLCQFVAAFALALLSLPLYLILDDLLVIFTFVVVLGGAFAGLRFARLERQRQEEVTSVEDRSRFDSVPCQQDDLYYQSPHGGAGTTKPASKFRGVQNYSRSIGGVALGIFFSCALMLWAVLIGKFCHDLGLLDNRGSFFPMRVIGVILALCAVCSVIALPLRNHTDLSKGVLLGLFAGCAFWSVVMFFFH